MQATVGFAPLHLVQTVKHKHDATAADRLGQPSGQRVTEFFRFCGDYPQ